jgi:hypothetical protein
MIYNWDYLSLDADPKKNSLYDSSEYQTSKNVLPTARKYYVFVITCSIPINKNIF